MLPSTETRGGTHDKVPLWSRVLSTVSRVRRGDVPLIIGFCLSSALIYPGLEDEKIGLGQILGGVIAAACIVYVQRLRQPFD